MTGISCDIVPNRLIPVRVPRAAKVAVGRILSVSRLMNVVPRRKAMDIPQKSAESESANAVHLVSLLRGIRDKFVLRHVNFERKQLLSGTKSKHFSFKSLGAKKFGLGAGSNAKMSRVMYFLDRSRSNNIRPYSGQFMSPTVRAILHRSKVMVGQTLYPMESGAKKASFTNNRSSLGLVSVPKTSFGRQTDGIRWVPPYRAPMSEVNKRRGGGVGRSVDDAGVHIDGSFSNHLSMSATINRGVVDIVPGSGYLAARSRSAMFDELAHPQYAGTSVGF